MDLALLNYLQQAQQQQSQTEPQNLLQQMPQFEQAEQPYNPFDAGISKAVSSARESLGMTDKQQQKALRRSILAYADSIRQQPRTSGLLNHFAQFGQALSPALQAYDTEEEAALNANQGMANQILAYRAAEQARQDKLEDRKLQRELQNERLKEIQRYHNLKNDIDKQKLAQNMGGIGANRTDVDEFGLVEGKYVPFSAKRERVPYEKDLKGSNYVISKITHILKNYEQFEKDTKDDVISPLAPYGLGKVSNYIKDRAGYLFKNQPLLNEQAKREALFSEIGTFQKESEKELKGAFLTKNMVDTFEKQGLLPSVQDPPHVFKSKIAALLNKAKSINAAAKQSLILNAHVDPEEKAAATNTSKTDIKDLNLNEVFNSSKSANPDIPAVTNIPMRNPSTGTVFSVPASRIQEFLDKGLEEIIE